MEYGIWKSLVHRSNAVFKVTHQILAKKRLLEANANPKTLEINFVDMPNAVQSNISLTSTVNLKMSDPDYHAVLIANKILGGGFNNPKRKWTLKMRMRLHERCDAIANFKQRN